MKKKTLGQQKKNTLAIFVNPWVAAVLALCPNLVLQLLLMCLKCLLNQETFKYNSKSSNCCIAQ